MTNEIQTTDRVVASPVIESMVRGEIDIQIKTAKQYPRDLAQSRNRATSMATMDEETATGCLYALPRRGAGKIEGGSIRLAEIIACTWGNLRIAKRILGEERSKVTAQGVCHDLETNNAVSLEVSRSILYSKNHSVPSLRGQRFPDDMIRVTEQAAASIALRNAIFAAIPKTQWAPVLAAAKRLAVGDAASLNETRTKTLASFSAIGVTKEQVLVMVGQGSVEEITLDDVGMLRGIFASLKSGESQIDDVLKQAGATGQTTQPTGSKVDRLAATIRRDNKFAEDAAGTIRGNTLSEEGLANVRAGKIPPPLHASLADLDRQKEPIARMDGSVGGECGIADLIAKPATATDDPGDTKCSKKTYEAVRGLWMPLSQHEKAPFLENHRFKAIMEVRQWTARNAGAFLIELQDLKAAETTPA